jgi:hypothetical protein
VVHLDLAKNCKAVLTRVNEQKSKFIDLEVEPGPQTRCKVFDVSICILEMSAKLFCVHYP